MSPPRNPIPNPIGDRPPSPAARAALVAVALVLLVSALPAPAAAVPQTGTQTTFEGSANVSFYQGVCQSIVHNVTWVVLPFDADVTLAFLTMLTPDSMAGKSGWAHFDVGSDGSYSDNATLDASTTSQNLNLTADSWNAYIAAQGLSSGNVSVPISVLGCPPAGGWNLTLSNLDVRFTYNGTGSGNAPVFSGPIPDLSMATETSVANAILAANYFSDADGEVLTYAMVKEDPSDMGWSWVTGTFTGNRLGFTAGGGWSGNLSFRITATDAASQTASSNNITLSVVFNQAPIIAGPVGDLVIPLAGAASIYLTVWDPEGYPLLTQLRPVDVNDSGWNSLEIGPYGDPYANISTWHNLTFGAYSAYVSVRNIGNWSGTVSAYFWAGDTQGHAMDSNVFNITGNDPPRLKEIYVNMSIAQGATGSLDLLNYFTDAENDPLTYYAIDQSSTNATTIPIVLSVSGWSLNISFSDSSWTGTAQVGLYACDEWSRCSNTRVINVTVYAPSVNQAPVFSGNISDFTLPVGGSVDPAFDAADYFTDPDNDTLSYSLLQSNASSEGWLSTMFTFFGSVVSVDNNATTSWTGSLCFRVMASADGGNATSNEVCIQILQPQNTPPIPVGTIPDQSAAAGSDELLSLDLRSYFIDDGSFSGLTFSIVQGPEAEWGSVSLAVEGTRLRIAFLTPVAPSDLTFTIRATDEWGASSSSALIDLHIAPNPTNRAPTLGGPLTLSLEQGASGTLNLGASAADPDGDPVAWYVAPSPPLVVSVDSAGVLAVIVPLSTPVSTYTLIVTITDPWGAVHGAEVKLEVLAKATPLPSTLTVQLNGAPVTETVDNKALEFAIAGQLGPGITVEWFVDGRLVGSGPTVSIAPLPAGSHTIETRVSNGAEETSIITPLTVRPVTPPVTIGPDPNAALAWTGALVSLAMVGAFLGLSERGRYFVVFAALGSVFARLKRDSLLDHFVRGRLYQAISDTPGIHLAELQRRAKVGHGTAIHHLRVLEKGGYVRVVPSGSLTRFYPTNQPLDDESYGLNDSDKAVLTAVAERPGITQTDLSSRVERSPATVSRSVSRLENLGYVTTQQRGRATAVFPRPGAKAADSPPPAWAQRGQ